MASVSVAEFEKALFSLKEAMPMYESENDLKIKTLMRDAVIQRFEFSCELSWKIAMKIIGLNPVAPKPAIRELARAGLISKPELWFDFIDARNKSSHSYDEDIAIQILSQIRVFIPEAELLLEALKQK